MWDPHWAPPARLEVRPGNREGLWCYWGVCYSLGSVGKSPLCYSDWLFLTPLHHPHLSSRCWEGREGRSLAENMRMNNNVKVDS